MAAPGTAFAENEKAQAASDKPAGPNRVENGRHENHTRLTCDLEHLEHDTSKHRGQAAGAM